MRNIVEFTGKARCSLPAFPAFCFELNNILQQVSEINRIMLEYYTEADLKKVERYIPNLQAYLKEPKPENLGFVSSLNLRRCTELAILHFEDLDRRLKVRRIK